MIDPDPLIVLMLKHNFFKLCLMWGALSHKLWTWNQCVTADGSLSTVIFLPQFPSVSELFE